MNGLALTVGVGVTGAFGAGARYLTAELFARWWSRSFPLATLMINLVGAFALGMATTALATPGQAAVRILLGAGFLGGYTTFSTLSYETLALARRGETGKAWLNAVVSVFGGMLAAAVGLWLGALL